MYIILSFFHLIKNLEKLEKYRDLNFIIIFANYMYNLELKKDIKMKKI